MQPSQLKSFQILVVDNERLMHKLICAVLNSLGFMNITTANSGRAAIEKIKQTNFDFVITDWRMGDLDGIDIVRFVRKSPDSPNLMLPIIMLTGNTEAHYVKEAISCGVNSYLIKPFSADQLTKRIRAIIETPRDFVITSAFTGPDRRHTEKGAPGNLERRRYRRKKLASTESAYGRGKQRPLR